MTVLMPYLEKKWKKVCVLCGNIYMTRRQEKYEWNEGDLAKVVGPTGLFVFISEVSLIFNSTHAFLSLCLLWSEETTQALCDNDTTAVVLYYHGD